MMSRRVLFALMLAMMLTGCWWGGPRFYQPDPQLASPLPMGLYEVDPIGQDKPSVRVRLVRRSDGSFVIIPVDAEGHDRLSFTLAKLPMPERALWIMQSNMDDKTPLAAYGLIEIRGDVLSGDPFMDCDENLKIARDAGANVDEDKVTIVDGIETHSKMAGSTCDFSDRASLERGLMAYAGAHPQLEARFRLKRIAD